MGYGINSVVYAICLSSLVLFGFSSWLYCCGVGWFYLLLGLLFVGV